MRIFSVLVLCLSAQWVACSAPDCGDSCTGGGSAGGGSAGGGSAGGGSAGGGSAGGGSAGGGSAGGGTAGGGTAGGSAGGTAGGGFGGAGGSAGGSALDAGVRYAGRAAISTLEHANDLHIATAVFARRELLESSDGCGAATERAGSCCFQPPGGTGGNGGGQVSAGTLRFEVHGTQVATLSPGVMGYFSAQWAPPTPPAPGDTVTLAATGDTVGAFTAQAVQPAPFASLVPAWGGTTPLTVDRTRDLTLSWQPGPSGDRVRLIMAAQGTGPGNPDRGVITCEVADSVGTLTVARSLFSHFQVGDVCSVCGLNRVAQGTASTANAEVTFELVLYGGGPAKFE